MFVDPCSVNWFVEVGNAGTGTFRIPTGGSIVAKLDLLVLCGFLT